MVPNLFLVTDLFQIIVKLTNPCIVMANPEQIILQKLANFYAILLRTCELHIALLYYSQKASEK